MERTREQTIEGLRKLADLLEANPAMALPYEGTMGQMLFMSHSREGFAATVKAFGRGVKEDGGDSLDFTPEFPLNVKVIGFKSTICEQRIVTRMVAAQPAIDIPARHVPAKEAYEETVTEYMCTPFLAGFPKVNA